MANRQIAEAFRKVKSEIENLEQKIQKVIVNQEFIVKEVMRLKESSENKPVNKTSKRKVSRKK